MGTGQQLMYLLILVVVLAVTKYYHGIGTRNVSAPEDVIHAMQSAELIYTRHANCRMDCREISKTEVLETLDEGKWNKAKSDLNDQPCPTYVLEDRTEDGQMIRVVFAYCGDVVKVVTAIDLTQEHKCSCD